MAATAASRMVAECEHEAWNVGAGGGGVRASHLRVVSCGFHGPLVWSLSSLTGFP